MPSDFCARLVAERRRLSVTQAEVAGWTNVHRKTQAAYEAGERYPDAAYLMTLLEHGFDVTYLLTGQVAPRYGSVDTDLLESVFVTLERCIEAAKRQVAPTEKAKLFSLIYQAAAESGRVDPLVAQKAVDLLD
ncbi:XRE family transcriptional regulator [Paraburkholderia sp. NMBU_R16]|uniref:helix-turn-helix domain-containing protein n=1 Tax=Paraburkholderia sp. NMBU_R16 TaxID=2698676 RepID=UPI0015647E63|nr:helix-turn-helix domain-containing protein [Paraburkholderia sp. NMBU_R16]NRO99330.1 XRE family transcriptional regulator [Paraburkholderia sp. NMBU_R16]